MVNIRADVAQWLPLLAVAFVFGAVVKIFPLDTPIALGVLGISTFALIILDAVIRVPRLTRIVSTVALLLLVLSLPFWCMDSGRVSPPPARPIYSFREAKADPHSFYRWWAFFVTEVVRTNAIIHGPDPTGVLPYRAIPGARTPFYKGEIVLNNRGYRGDDMEDVKGDLFRIVTIGDSTTFGQTVFPESRPWSAVLQELIRSRLRCNREIQVINGGANAWELKNGIDRIEADISWLKPDMLLPYIAWVGLESLDPDRHWIPEIKTGELDLIPAGHSRLQTIAWFIKKSASDFRSGLFAKLAEMDLVVQHGNRDEILAQARSSSLYRDYERLIELGRRHGFRVVLISGNTAVTPDAPRDAVTFYEGGFRETRSKVALVRILNWALEDLARKHRETFFLDTSEGLHGRYEDDLFLDLVHFTSAGDVRMAENVFRGLRPILVTDPGLACTPR